MTPYAGEYFSCHSAGICGIACCGGGVDAERALGAAFEDGFLLRVAGRNGGRAACERAHGGWALGGGR